MLGRRSIAAYLLLLALFLGIVLIPSASPAHAAPGVAWPAVDVTAVPAPIRALFAQADDCPTMITGYAQNAQLARLIDPQLATQDEIEQASQDVRRLYDCLRIADQPLDDRSQMLLTLAEYFLIFVAGQPPQGDPGRLELVDLATSNDPAVVRLRDQAGLPPPPGYVFVRSYPSREAMPELARRPFQDPQVAGVTYLTRYIALLDEDKASWAEQALEDQALPATTSHELVHAYLNASLGPTRENDLPRWYHEGLAVYFSGSGEEHVIVTPSFSLSQTTTTEYKSFELIFKYLEDRLGKGGLYQALRQTLTNGDAAPLYQAAGLTSESWLLASAESWQQQRLRSRYLLLLAVSLSLFAGLFMLAPEYECECGHTGHRSDFPGGACKECGRHLPAAQRLRRWKPLRLYAHCEVCGRRYWRWQFGALHFHTWRVRAWRYAPAEPGQPAPIQMLWVHRICESCAAAGQQVYQDYAARTADEIAAERQRLLPLYSAWLMQAPLRPYNSFARQDSLNFLHALELCVHAALAARYPDWVDSQAAFQLVLPPGDDTPAGYAQILRRPAEIQGTPVTLLGSVGRLNSQIVLIVWEAGRRAEDG
jgi:hypothetical protein